MSYACNAASNMGSRRKRRQSKLRFLVVLSLWSAAAQAAFNDAHDVPPTGWTGPVFKLSQAYPKTLPKAGTRPWQRFDFKNPAEAPQYMSAVLSYCLEGNAADNFADVAQ